MIAQRAHNDIILVGDREGRGKWWWHVCQSFRRRAEAKQDNGEREAVKWRREALSELQKAFASVWTEFGDVENRDGAGMRSYELKVASTRSQCRQWGNCKAMERSDLIGSKSLLSEPQSKLESEFATSYSRYAQSTRWENLVGSCGLGLSNANWVG